MGLPQGHAADIMSHSGEELLKLDIGDFVLAMVDPKTSLTHGSNETDAKASKSDTDEPKLLAKFSKSQSSHLLLQVQRVRFRDTHDSLVPPGFSRNTHTDPPSSLIVSIDFYLIFVLNEIWVLNRC